MVFTLGKPVGQYLIAMPKETLTESIPGKHYHLHIETNGITNSQTVANALIDELSTKFKAKVKYIRINNSNIDLQLEGSPFAWATLLLWLPQILVAFGIITTLITVWGIVSTIPSWAWATLGIGVVFIILGPSIAKAVLTSKVR